MIKETVKEKFKQPFATHTFRNYDLSSPEASAIDQKIADLFDCRYQMPTESFEAKYKNLIDQLQKFVTKEKVVTNIVVKVGRSTFAARLAGSITSTGTINYGALGSATPILNDLDTQLGTEVFRKVVATSSSSFDVSLIDFYFSKADTNGTYNEWGTFIDGTGTVNSGIMFSHALTGGWSKLSTEGMTITTQYTWS